MQEGDIIQPKFQNECLKVLSFFEPMALDQIFLELDPHFVSEYPQLTYEDLTKTLDSLEKLKKIKVIKQEKFKLYQKLFPKKSLTTRIKNILKK